MANDSLTVNLPKLRSDHNVKLPATRGDWSSRSSELFLEDLASALELDTTSGLDLQSIKSVPHTWGHLIMFQSALLNPEHPAHEAATAQWRGLLSMLALRIVDQGGVGAVKTETCRLVDAGDADDPRDRLRRVVGRQRLKPRAVGDDWSAMHLLYAVPSDPTPPHERQPVLVGVLSPSTIVAPARDFSGDPRLPQFWLRGRKGIEDPTRSERLTSDELRICQHYVQNLRDVLRTVPVKDKYVLNGLITQLDEFAAELERKGALHAIGHWRSAPQNDLVPDDDFRSEVGALSRLYRALNDAWVEDRDKDVTHVTDLLLEELDLSRPVGSDPQKKLRLILADRRYASDTGRRPEHVSLFGYHTLAELDDPEPDGTQRIPEKLRKEAEARNIVLLTPNDLLAGCLTKLKKFKSAQHPTRDFFDDKLLPVTPAALLLHETLNDVKENLTSRGTQQPDVRLTVKVHSKRTESEEKRFDRLYEVRRRYGGESGVSDAYAPSVLAAWPDFRMKDGSPLAFRRNNEGGHADQSWKWNFLYASTNVSRKESERSVVATVGLSRDLLLDDLKVVAHAKTGALAEGSTLAECVRNRLTSWGSPDGLWPSSAGAESQGERLDEHETGEVKTEWRIKTEWLRIRKPRTMSGQDPQETILQRCDAAFEAVLFRLPNPVAGFVYAGLGLLPEARHVEPKSTKNATIACDFGTSNTIVYSNRDGGRVAPLHFRSRLRKFNSLGDGDRDTEYASFMPRREVRQPFPTVMQLRAAAGLETAWENANEPPLWLDSAFFDPDVIHLTESLLSGTGGADLVFDLKWGSEESHRRRMARYLRHITILSMAEVVESEVSPESIEWRFSYPISADNVNEYQQAIQSGALPECRRVVFETESEAALKYFRQATGKSAESSTVALDIGGGSADIALRTRRKGLIWQQSVRLAGETLMTDFLLRNRGYLKRLKLDNVGRSGVFGDHESLRRFMNPRPDEGDASQAARNATSAIINSPRFGDRFADEWIYTKNSPEATLLRAGVAVMVCGLSRFLNRQIGALLKDPNVELDVEDLGTMRLCFGGRGSTLLKLWHENDEGFDRLIAPLKDDAKAGKEGALGATDLEPYFSLDMKHEAAKGMLSDSSSETSQAASVDGRAPIASSLALGIGGALNGTAVDSMDLIESLSPASSVLDARAGAAEHRPQVAWEEYDEFLASVGDRSGLRIELNRFAQTDIRTTGGEALSVCANKDRSCRYLEPPFIAMLRLTMCLIYEGRSVKVTADE